MNAMPFPDPRMTPGPHADLQLRWEETAFAKEGWPPWQAESARESRSLYAAIADGSLVVDWHYMTREHGYLLAGVTWHGGGESMHIVDEDGLVSVQETFSSAEHAISQGPRYIEEFESIEDAPLRYRETAATLAPSTIAPHPADALALNRPGDAPLQALAAAAHGIRQASDAWDAVSDSFCDEDGWPVDEEGYADGKVERDAAAWQHVEVFLAHGPEVLAGVRAAAHGADYVEGPISEDLRRLRGIEDTLDRAGQIRREWDEVMALMDASLPGSRETYASQAQEIRNAEGWHYADELSGQGLVLVRVAEFLADRTDADPPAQNGRVQAALARSTSGNRGAPIPPPPAPSAPKPPPARRSR
jgi:hypothetical protein